MQCGGRERLRYAHYSKISVLLYLNCHLSGKLDGYEVRLGTVRAEALDCELEYYGEGGAETDCQNVSGSWSCRHSGPKPNLNEETDHLARWPMSGHGSTGGLRTVIFTSTVQR